MSSITAADLTTLLTTATVPSASIFCLSDPYETIDPAYLTGKFARWFKGFLVALSFRIQEDTERTASLARGAAYYATYLQDHVLPTPDPLALGELVYISDDDALKHSVLIGAYFDGEDNVLKTYDLQPGQDGDGQPTIDIVEVSLSPAEYLSSTLARF